MYILRKYLLSFFDQIEKLVFLEVKTLENSLQINFFFFFSIYINVNIAFFEIVILVRHYFPISSSPGQRSNFYSHINLLQKCSIKWNQSRQGLFLG